MKDCYNCENYSASYDHCRKGYDYIGNCEKFLAEDKAYEEARRAKEIAETDKKEMEVIMDSTKWIREYMKVYNCDYDDAVKAYQEALEKDNLMRTKKDTHKVNLDALKKEFKDYHDEYPD